MRRHGLNIVAILVVSLGIYLFRYHRAQQSTACPTLCQKPDGSLDLNPSAFANDVIADLTLDHAYQLIVFVDPDRECLACLFETEYWLAPLTEVNDYAVHFMMPHDAPDARVQGYLDAFHIEPTSVTRFDIDGPLGTYYQFGLLKVLYHVEHGILWVDGGNEGERDQQQFLQKLRTSSLNRDDRL